jgi:hypothetical protein
LNERELLCRGGRQRVPGVMPVVGAKAMLAVYASSAGAVGQRAAVRAVCKGIEFDVLRLNECKTVADIVWDFGWAEGSAESDMESMVGDLPATAPMHYMLLHFLKSESRNAKRRLCRALRH